MTCRHFLGLVAITILQACSTTSAAEATSATIVEDTAENSCRSHETLPGSGGCRVDVQSNPRQTYKWVDKEGNIYYGDCVPPEFADKAKDVLIDQWPFASCSIDGEYFCGSGYCAELFLARARVIELYIIKLFLRLADLQDEAKCCMPYNSDPNAPMIEESLIQDIRDTRETIKRHQADLEKIQSACP